MFGKYFKHVLVLTILTGMAYSLPQVKSSMVGAFGFLESNQAFVSNYNSSTSPTKAMIGKMDIVRKDIENNQIKNQIISRRAIILPPEEVIAILFKAGVISKEKLPLALRIIREHASSTNIVNEKNIFIPTQSPFNSSSTIPSIKEREKERDREKLKINNELRDVKIEVI